MQSLVEPVSFPPIPSTTYQDLQALAHKLIKRKVRIIF